MTTKEIIELVLHRMIDADVGEIIEAAEAVEKELLQRGLLSEAQDE